MLEASKYTVVHVARIITRICTNLPEHNEEELSLLRKCACFSSLSEANQFSAALIKLQQGLESLDFSIIYKICETKCLQLR